MPNKLASKVQILGVGVSSTTCTEVLAKIEKERLFIVTVNPEFVMLAQDDPEFKNILNSADLAIPDGVGLRFARPGLVIVPGRKLVEEIIKTKKYKIFYLGGQSGVAEAMAKKYNGFFDSGHENIKSQITNSQINSQIIKKINDYKPDILLVAYGAPWQEKWIWNNLTNIKARVCIGVGGTFDYLTGRSAIPPKIIEKLGLEWLWRLILQPWRWKRQLNLVRFIIAIFKPSF